MTTIEIQKKIAELGPWFYEFDLGPHGRIASTLPPGILGIFSTRLEMVNRVVEGFFGSRISKIRCIDVGCHEGFYSLAMARKGVRHARGIDLRESNLRKARFIAEALGVSNVEYQQGNCEDLRPETVGQYELCLFLGILYHLENPMLCLRNISRITRELCIVESQVIEEIQGFTEWGAQEWTRPYQGSLALIDESGEFYAQNAETGASPLALCPSPRAVQFMLQQAGFRRTELIAPRPDAYEQHGRGKRVVFAAYK